MIINCKLCPFQAKSLNVISEQALAEVGAKLAKHLGEKHVEMIATINQVGVKVGMIGMWLVTINLAANIPETETYILREKDKHEAEFMSLMGFDREEPNPEDSLLRKYITELMKEEHECSDYSTVTAEKKGMLFRIIDRLDKIARGEIDKPVTSEKERSEAD